MRARRLRLVTAIAALAALAVACGDANDERGASSQPQGASLRVTLGTQEFPEARILGELWRQALAANGYTVNLRKGVGPAEDLDEALMEEEIDGYVAYTGTVLSIVAFSQLERVSRSCARARAASRPSIADRAWPMLVAVRRL